jgi:hypothetical protein
MESISRSNPNIFKVKVRTCEKGLRSKKFDNHWSVGLSNIELTFDAFHIFFFFFLVICITYFQHFSIVKTDTKNGESEKEVMLRARMMCYFSYY